MPHLDAIAEDPNRQQMREALEAIPPDPTTGKRECLCGDLIAPSGWRPHMDRHVREGTYEQSTTPPANKAAQRQKRKYTKRPAVDEACLALLAATVGDKIPLSMVGDVQQWVNDTKKLIESLR